MNPSAILILEIVLVCFCGLLFFRVGFGWFVFVDLLASVDVVEFGWNFGLEGHLGWPDL